MASADTDDEKTVILIGAGLAGLSLSLGLIKEGFKVELVEKSHDFSRTGATLGVNPNGGKALEEICPGILAALKELGIPMSNGGTMLGWWAMRDTLLQLVRQEKDKITIRNGWLIDEIENGSECIKAKFQKRQQTNGHENLSGSDTELTLVGCILIGADGVNSAVRNLLHLLPAKDAKTSCWRSRINIAPEDESEAANLLRPYLDIPVVPMGMRLYGPMNYALFNFHEKIPGTMALVLNYRVDPGVIPPGASPKKYIEARIDDEKEMKEFEAIFDLADRDGLTHPVRLKVIELPEENSAGWGGEGRVTIIGDAAHGMRPASGLGAAMAFEDSVVLCRTLRKYKQQQGELTAKTDVERALREFEVSRLPRVRTIWNDQWERSESVYGKTPMEPWSKEFEIFVYQGV